MKEDQVIDKDKNNVSDENIDQETNIDDLNEKLEQMNKKNEDYKNQIMYLQANFQFQIQKEYFIYILIQLVYINNQGIRIPHKV